MKKAYQINPETGEYLFDWYTVYPDEKGEYVQPKNTTWAEPIKNDGTYFIMPVFKDGFWQEGGTPPEPAPIGISDSQRIANLTMQLAMKDAQIKSLQQQHAQSSLKLASIELINNEQQTKLAAIEKKVAALS